MTEQIVDAEVVDEGGMAPPDPATTGALVTRPAGSTNLFRTDDPAEVLAKAQATAEALMPVVRGKNLIAKIQGRDHLTVEAWQTLGAMLGVTPVCEWTRPLENGWEARVEARTLDGRVIGAAEAECLRSESSWASRDDYALRSMAQTRATSKALASVLRFVATLAGVEGTPAEEMPGEQKAPEIERASEDLQRSAKRALGRLTNDPDRAMSIWTEVVNAFGGICPSGVAVLLTRLSPPPDPEPIPITGQNPEPAMQPDTRDLAA